VQNTSLILSVIPMDKKRCVRCGEDKLLTEFHRNSRSKDGLHSYCKKCNMEKATAHSKTDKGKASLKRALAKAVDKGYYRFGKGAIPILKQGAEKRGVAFDLTADILEQWWHNQPDVCSYCKNDLSEYLALRDFILSYVGNNNEIKKFKRFYRNPKHQSIRWMTIDRIDNERGYVIENMVKACWICNSLKSDFFDGVQMSQMAPTIIGKLKREIEKEKV